MHLPNYLAPEAEPLPGRLCNCTNLRILSTRRMAAIDPMDMIQPSIPAASEAGDHPDAEMPDQQHVRVHEDNGPMIVLAKTPDGIRTLLGRKKRKRPLLAIECKGCKMTSHDQDIFVQGDSLEFLDYIT